MPAPINSNQYKFPLGYRQGILRPSSYSPWNGFVNGNNSPQAIVLGATLQIVTSAAPANLSTLRLVGANGNLYTFQFVYAASTNTLGIQILLPASGASSAAQVLVQIASVLSLPGGTPFGESPVVYPWTYQPINATTARLNANIGGNFYPNVAPSGVNVTIIAISSTVGLSAGISPGRLGPVGAFLPGI